MPNLAESYAAALLELTQGKSEKEAGKAVARFVELLNERNELYLAPKILEAYGREVRKADGVESVSFSSAEELSDAERKRVAKELSASIGKPVEVAWKTDPSLVAGAVIRYADRLVDASVKGKLARLKQRLA